MKGNRYIFYTPEEQYPGMPHGEMCGDIMPFYQNGVYTLFFLYKYCIYAVDTEDFVHYGDCRLVLQNGSPDEQDWHAATGSVFFYEGRYYFYYTGFCEGNRGEKGKHEQAILRAVSNDFYHWEKDADYLFCPDEQYFKGLHWRDPQVFWNEEIKKFCMLVTAERKDGPCLKSGCTAVYISEDMIKWKFYKIIYAPDIYPTHECQDAFRMGEKWYLIFSTYSRWWETRYRIADGFEGEWETPALDDMFDGREFYAAKTVSDGKNRYLIGWQSIRKDCSDNEKFVWGGNVVVHKLCQREDKTLGVVMPDTIYDSFQRELPLEPKPVLGTWKEEASGFIGMRQDGFGWMQLGDIDGTLLLETSVTWKEDTAALGFMIHTSGEQLEKWCQLRMEPSRGRIVMERYNQIDGDQFYLDERRITFAENCADLKLLVSGNIMQVYVNDTALTTRCYGALGGGIGLFVECGQAAFENTRLLLGEEENNV